MTSCPHRFPGQRQAASLTRGNFSPRGTLPPSPADLPISRGKTHGPITWRSCGGTWAAKSRAHQPLPPGRLPEFPRFRLNHGLAVTEFCTPGSPTFRSWRYWRAQSAKPPARPAFGEALAARSSSLINENGLTQTSIVGQRSGGGRECRGPNRRLIDDTEQPIQFYRLYNSLIALGKGAPDCGARSSTLRAGHGREFTLVIGVSLLAS